MEVSRFDTAIFGVSSSPEVLILNYKEGSGGGEVIIQVPEYGAITVTKEELKELYDTLIPGGRTGNIRPLHEGATIEHGVSINFGSWLNAVLYYTELIMAYTRNTVKDMLGDPGLKKYTERRGEYEKEIKRRFGIGK